MPNGRHQKRRPTNGGNDPPPSSQPPKRRKAMGVVEFATGPKGHNRALKEYHNKKKRKFVQNAALLREYKRTMKNEGYDAGKGASRKRPLEDGEDGNGGQQDGRKRKGTDDELEHPQQPHGDGALNSEGGGKARKRSKKSDPFAKSMHRASVAKERRRQEMDARVERQRQTEAKIAKRKKRARVMSKRTRTGQPVMRNVIGSLLEKLQGEVGDTATNGGRGEG